jgi:hypothetical protein
MRKRTPQNGLPWEPVVQKSPPEPSYRSILTKQRNELLAIVRSIACLDDNAAHVRRVNTGSYSLFDEPASARLCIEYLERIGDLNGRGTKP